MLELLSPLRTYTGLCLLRPFFTLGRVFSHSFLGGDSTCSSGNLPACRKLSRRLGLGTELLSPRHKVCCSTFHLLFCVGYRALMTSAPPAMFLLALS